MEGEGLSQVCLVKRKLWCEAMVTSVAAWFNGSAKRCDVNHWW